MKQLLISATLLLGATMAWAHGCPREMKAIDAKLSSAQLSAETLAKVQELRAQGEQFHKDGKHTESMAALAEAKKLLGM